MRPLRRAERHVGIHMAGDPDVQYVSPTFTLSLIFR